jgi:hypothetical protein
VNLSNPSQTTTSSGPFNVSFTGGYSISVPPPNTTSFSDSNTGSQNSQVTGEFFTDSATVSEQSGPTYSPFDPNGDVNSESSYKVDFSVSAPTPFSVTGQYSFTGGGKGPVGTFNAYVSFTNTTTSSQLFMLGYINAAGGADLGLNLSGGPTNFATMLEPGNTYELVADAYVDRPIDGTTHSPDEQATVSLSAGVPEPASVGVIAAITLAALARRRRFPHQW